MSKSPLSPNLPDLDGADSRPLDAPDETHVTFIHRRQAGNGDRYDVGRLFVEWAWFTGFSDGGDRWDGAVRALARTLRGLQASGLIERRTIRRVAHPTHHGFVVTTLGQQALHALSGEWIRDDRSRAADVTKNRT